MTSTAGKQLIQYENKASGKTVYDYENASGIRTGSFGAPHYLHIAFAL